MIESAVIQCEDQILQSSDLHLDKDEATSSGLDGLLELPFRDAVAQFEQRYFDRLLQRTNGNKTKAAELADIERTVLHAHLRKLSGSSNE